MRAHPEGDRERGGAPLRSLARPVRSDDVAAGQRRRLTDAMVALAGERGYAAATVAHLIRRAGVSRKTFYEQFADRSQLLLAAFDAACPPLLEQVRAASQRTGGSARQLESAMRRLCRLSLESPGAIAIATTEIAAAGPDGARRHDDLTRDLGRLISACLHDGGEHALPPTLARALAGATLRTIDAHLRAGRSDQLPDLGLQLARWTRGQHPVPPALLRAAQPPPPWPSAGSPDGLLGGRAPGTLALLSAAYPPHGASRSSGFVQHTNRERIFDAVAQLIAERGYVELTAAAIAERADLPERAFLAHFKSSDEAFAAALELGHAKGQAVVQRARASVPAWGASVRAAVQALAELLAAEPLFTHMAFVDAPLAGPSMAQRAHEHLRAYARLLFDGAPQRRRPPPIAPEAAVHALAELAFHHASRAAAARLHADSPEIAYLSLAPFLGVTEAAALAAGASA